MKNIGNVAPESELQKKKAELKILQASLVGTGRTTLSQERAATLGLEEVKSDKGLYDSLLERETALIVEIDKLSQKPN